MSRFHPPQIIRVIVYMMLVLSAGAAILFGGRLWAAAEAGSLPSWAPLLPACGFTAFMLVYGVDRWLLVRRRNFPAGRAFLQVAFTVLFLSLLWPREAAHYQVFQDTVRKADPVERLLRHRDPDVRAAACELLGLRAQVNSTPALAATVDRERLVPVRQACQAALERLNGIGAEVP